MTRKQFGGLVIMTMLAGLVGGFLSSRVLLGEAVIAQEPSQPAKIVEA